MTLRITIDIFSGRPNPVVIVSGREEIDLLERLAASRQDTTKDKTRLRRAPRLPESILGYRGLIIERFADSVSRGVRSTLPASFRVAGGFVYGPRTATPARDAFVEDYICGSTGPFRVAGLDKHFFDICQQEIQRLPETVAKWSWKESPWPIKKPCTCAPVWEPEWWNDNSQIQLHNNCYNYATNYRSDSYAQPGMASGAVYPAIACSLVKAGAVADGLIDSPLANNKCPPEGHLVALAIWSTEDFHWYRKGRNGYWTHKPGPSQITQLDNSGHLIADPRTADRGNYTQFCTFMLVMHGHVKIR